MRYSMTSSEQSNGLHHVHEKRGAMTNDVICGTQKIVSETPQRAVRKRGNAEVSW